MADGNSIAVPAPLLWGALALLLGGSGTTAYFQTQPEPQVLTVVIAQQQHDRITARINEVEIGLLCFGKGNAERSIKYWKGENKISPLTVDQLDMLADQEEFLLYYKLQLVEKRAKPCID